MPRTVGKPIHLVKDMWIAYAERLLKKDPTLVSRYGNKCKHFKIFTVLADGRLKEVNSYARFRRVIEFYFDKAKTAVIHGECINMTAGIGKICPKRVERDFTTKKQRMINWGKTKKQKLVWDDNKQKMVYEKVIYFTDKEWCRIGWAKTGMITNETVYEFRPAKANSEGTSGFKGEFTAALKADPLLKFQYLYNPINGPHKKRDQ